MVSDSHPPRNLRNFRNVVDPGLVHSPPSSSGAGYCGSLSLERRRSGFLSMVSPGVVFAFGHGIDVAALAPVLSPFPVGGFSRLAVAQRAREVTLAVGELISPALAVVLVLPPRKCGHGGEFSRVVRRRLRPAGEV